MKGVRGELAGAKRAGTSKQFPLRRLAVFLAFAGILGAQAVPLNTGKFWRLTWRIRELERQIKDSGPDPAWIAALASVNAEFQVEQARLWAQCGSANYLGNLTDAAGNVADVACIPKPSGQRVAPTTSKWNLPKRAIQGLKQLVR